MEIILSNQNSWNSFFGIALILLALYFLLSFTRRMLDRVYFLGKLQDQVKRIIHYILLIYEPLAVLLLSSVFLRINPVVHGVFLAIVLIICYSYIRNYMNGRLVQTNKNIVSGVKMKTGKLKGIVKSTNRFGLYLQNKEGMHYVSYNHLAEDGYTLVAGEEIGGFYHLSIIPKGEETKRNHLQYLRDVLSITPYIDWHQKPDLKLVEGQETEQFEARFLLKEESQLQELVALIREWGYTVNVLK